MKILISDKSSPKCAEILHKAGHEVDEIFGLSPEELKNIIGIFDALIVRGATKVTAEIIQAAKKLKVIGRAGTGVDNIDVKAASTRGIVVMNAPGGNSNAVAELVLGQMLMLARSLYDAAHTMKEARWEKKRFEGTEIIGKNLGILGYGRVSRLLAQKARALGMQVRCYDPKIGKDLVDEASLAVVSSLEDVLSWSDYLSVHLSLREDTQNFISRAQFQRMKRGVYVLNCSRGGIVNEADLLWALEEGIVAGAALDVFEKEPPTDFTLAKHPQVIAMPHIGAATEEAQENVSLIIAEQIADMFAGKGIRNAVN
ncbi:MAG: hydroxyacid dehydrogenase [Calditrichaceae bacterium]|nr:hydroxyacid dehydrogenase [Calditrichia bacterium]NUQ43991.1 hydroxyacid dehydrogenase [Calditrichaceae bacterium]